MISPIEEGTSPENETSSVEATTSNVAEIVTEATGEVRNVLDISGIESAIDKAKLQAAWAFLHEPGEKPIADMAQHARAVGGIIGDYQMTGADAPAVVDDVYNRLERMRYLRLIADARTELAQAEPDLMKLLPLAVAASSICKPEGAEATQLKKDIAERNLHSETYDQMRDLAAMAKEAREHLADKARIHNVGGFVTALENADRAHIALTINVLVPALLRDAGKDGEPSKAAIKDITDRMTELGEKLLAAAQ